MASDNFGENDDEDPDHKGQVFISPIHETARETLVPCVKMTLLMMRAMDTTVILHVHLSQDPKGRSGFWSLGNWTSGIKFFGQKPKIPTKCLKNPKCRPRSTKLECSSVSQDNQQEGAKMINIW